MQDVTKQVVLTREYVIINDMFYNKVPWKGNVWYSKYLLKEDLCANYSVIKSGSLIKIIEPGRNFEHPAIVELIDGVAYNEKMQSIKKLSFDPWSFTLPKMVEVKVKNRKRIL